MCVGVWGGKGEKGREGYQAVPPTRRDSERVGRRRVTEKEMEKKLENWKESGWQSTQKRPMLEEEGGRKNPAGMSQRANRSKINVLAGLGEGVCAGIGDWGACERRREREE